MAMSEENGHDPLTVQMVDLLGKIHGELVKLQGLHAAVQGIHTTVQGICAGRGGVVECSP